MKLGDLLSMVQFRALLAEPDDIQVSFSLHGKEILSTTVRAGLALPENDLGLVRACEDLRGLSGALRLDLNSLVSGEAVMRIADSLSELNALLDQSGQKTSYAYSTRGGLARRAAALSTAALVHLRGVRLGSLVYVVAFGFHGEIGSKLPEEDEAPPSWWTV